MDSKGLAYLILLLFFVVMALFIAVFTGIKNYIQNKKADKNKVIFKNIDGSVKGFWKSTKGEKFDKNLKPED